MHKYAAFEVLAAAYAPRSGPMPLMRTAHRHEFDYMPRPGFLYVRSRAISSRTNDNFDTFPAEEIKKAYRTFVGKPVFVNHHNANHRRCRGVIKDAVLHEDVNPDGTPDTWVEVLMEIDAIKFPKLAEAVVKGEIDRTSMGTDVKFSICSFCGNKAETPLDYCSHIPRLKGKRIERRTANGTKEHVLVSEVCYGLGFFENSLLVEDPADPTAYTFGVDTRGLEAAGVKVEATRIYHEDKPHAPWEDVPSTARCDGPGCRKRIKTNTDKWAMEWSQDTDDNSTIYDYCSDACWDAHHKANAALFTESSRKQAKTKDEYVAPSTTDDPTRYDGMTIRKDDDGYYVHTHRARSKSYPSPEAIPDSAVKFIESTGAKTAAYKTVYERGCTHPLTTISTTAEPDYAQGDVAYCDTCETQTVITAVHGPPPASDPYSHFSLRVNAMFERLAVDVEEIVAAGLAVIAEDTGRLLMLRRRDDDETAPGTWEFPGGKLDDGEQPLDAAKREWQEEVGACLPPGRVVCVWSSPDGVYRGFGYAVPREGDVPLNLTQDDRHVFNPDEPDDDASPARWYDVAEAIMLPDLRPEVRDTPWEKLVVGMDVAATKTVAYGETKAPPDVDTLRDEQCPVCGDQESFSGAECAVCGYIAPPKEFQDPDLDRARQLDLRQETDERNGDVALKCDACGATFDAKTKPQPTAPADQPPAKTGAGKPPWLDGGKDDKKSAADDPATKQQPDDAVDDEVPETAPQAGDTCPECGKGRLVEVHEVPEEQAPEEDDQAPPDASEDAEDDEGEDTKNEGSGPKKPKKKDDGKKPPFGKNTAAARHGATSKETVDMPPTNPAQEQRTRLLAALAAQQRQIDAQAQALTTVSNALVTIANAAGIQHHPTMQAVAALLPRTADVNNPAQPVADPASEAAFQTTEQALAPDATDDPQNMGAAPPQANQGVTPDATTSVQSPEVTLDTSPVNELQDVTAPVAGTEGPRPDSEVKIKPEIVVGNPNNPATAFPETGWTAAQHAAAAAAQEGAQPTAPAEAPPQHRLLASVKLARLRKAAGVEDGDELGLGQTIHDSDMTDDQIATEMATLERVLTSQRGGETRQPVARNLVPQAPATARVARTMPSLTGGGGATPPIVASASTGAVTDDEVAFG